MNKDTQDQHVMTDDQLDQLLATTGQLQIPDDFEQRVMQEITALPDTAADNKGISLWWQLAGLIGAGIPGVTQVTSFIFSTWTVAATG